jgi:hypothetical protein
LIFHDTGRTLTVNSRIHDPVGTGVALLVGLLLGITFAAPILPRTIPFGNVTLGPTQAVIVAGTGAIVVVGLAIVGMYIVLAQHDR